MDKYKVLENYFGYKEFRVGQEAIIDSILDKQDTLVVMATGGGKSICFQVPALMYSGMTIVISPLISLMSDQVRELRNNNISAEYINSSLAKDQIDEVKENVLNNKVKILYLSPERLLHQFIVSLVGLIEINFIVIDEAHTILWHLDFRKSFLDIKKFIGLFKRRPVIACFTATANSSTILEIKKAIEINDFKVIKNSFDRNELFYKVVSTKSKLGYLLNYINNNYKVCGIIYCLTRKKVMELYHYLSDNGCSVTYYHGGLDNDIKKLNQDSFITNKSKIIVCTISFGMGINKPDIRYVINYEMPSSLEDFAQMTGRCSRDGGYGECLVFYDKKDILTSKYFIDSIEDDERKLKEILAIKRYKFKQLNSVIDFCKSNKCLHRQLALYFDERINNCEDKCLNCQKHFS